MNWLVPLADVQLGKEEEEAVLSVMRSGWLTMGSVTQAFEQEFSEFTGAKHAFAVTNATVALHMACLAVGVGPDDEVIVPSLSFVASANAIAYTGAKPVFADIESLTWPTISPQAIQAAITPKTKAIMVVHYAGFSCDMPAIMAIAKQHHLAVIEDAAHAVGASLSGKALGTWGDVGCFSFFGNKNLTTGEGGMILTDNDELADKIRLLRSHGMTTLTWDRHQGHASTYDVVALGYNYRIDEIRSAIGRVQLGRIPAGNARRADLVAMYREKFTASLPDLILPFADQRGQSSYHIMPVLLPEGVSKSTVMQQLKDQGIQTSWHYPLIHKFSIYQEQAVPDCAGLAEHPRSEAKWDKTEHAQSTSGWHRSCGASPERSKAGQDRAPDSTVSLPTEHNQSTEHSNLPISIEFSQRQLTLPLFPTMTDAQLDLVVSALTKALSQH